MQHPFEGVMQLKDEPTATMATRRALLRGLLGAVAGVFVFATAAVAQSLYRRPTTLAYGEEGGRVTTYALGEEGGYVTTYALGEEGGWWPPRQPPTTLATGEEGGWMPPPPTPSLPPVAPIRPVPPPRYPTTLALGEEGGRR